MAASAPSSSSTSADPEHYEKHKAHVSFDTAALMPDMMTWMASGPNQSILDYGCGGGSTLWTHLVPDAQNTDSKIYGVDCSEEMISFAQQKYPHPNVEYIQANILDGVWPLEGKKFDRIFGIYVMAFVEDYKQLVKMLSALLAPGGRIGIIAVYNCEYFRQAQRLKDDFVWSDMGKLIVTHHYTIEQNAKADKLFSGLFEAEGLKVVEKSTHQRSYPLNIETLIGVLTSQLPPVGPGNRAARDEWYRKDLKTNWPPSCCGAKLQPDEVALEYDILVMIAERQK